MGVDAISGVMVADFVVVVIVGIGFGGVVAAVAIIGSPVFIILLIATSFLFCVFAIKKHGAVAVRMDDIFFKLDNDLLLSEIVQQHGTV